MRENHVLGWYGRERGPLWLVFALFAGIFALVFGLYGLSLKVVAYPALLCLFLGLVLLALDFWHYRSRHRQRQALRENIELNLDRLPLPETLAEAELGEMLQALGALRSAQISASRAQEQESLDYYAAWVHQIKTPIAAMGMLLQGEDSEEHRALQGELFRIEQYVEMVLSYLRLRGEGTDFVFREVALDGVIRQAVRKFAPQFVRKRIRLRYEETQERVLTDEKWLHFILEQLLSNAIKYTPSGEIAITVQDKVLTVADSGIGIAPEDLPRIFERGFTGYNGHADKKATGLGLYLCQQAARRLGIAITVESVVGQGSAFHLDLHTEQLEVE